MSLGGQQLLEYLEKLPGTAFRRLYQSPATALAVFRRMLSYHGMQLALVLIPSYVPLANSLFPR